MNETSLLRELIESLRCLPGVGPKSAQRMAFHLLERDRTGAEHLAQVMSRAMAEIGHCQRCQTLSEQDVCRVCADSERDGTQLCVVESPSDVMALEQATAYRGLYFVLGGRLSPLDGIGPTELGMHHLRDRLAEKVVKELILATTTTVEGEATAHYISELAEQFGCQITRIAHGVPLGGELEYVDSGTLAHAFAGRQQMQ